MIEKQLVDIGLDMSKKIGDLNWDELKKSDDDYTHEPTALWAADTCGGGKQGVDPLNKSKPVNVPGEIPKKPSNEEIAEFILKGKDVNGGSPLGQPTDEQLFGHLVTTEEQLQKAEEDWDNKLNNFYKAAQSPIVPKEEEKLEWGDGASFNESLTEEERLKRNMFNDKNSN